MIQGLFLLLVQGEQLTRVFEMQAYKSRFDCGFFHSFNEIFHYRLMIL